jgi:tRNA A-37 threonylcarbamoyl transferase component Bud32
VRLLSRLHYEGWIHGSFFTRNIVEQYGPLHVRPNLRQSDHLSFRIIDFGRSYKDTGEGKELLEELKRALEEMLVDEKGFHHFSRSCEA